MKTMRKLFLFFVFTLSAISAMADIQVTTSIKDGDRLSGVVEVRVTVRSESQVNVVEFYVDGDLRGTDSSTPYVFMLDTVLEKEGPMVMEIHVYTAKGEDKKIKLNLVVDNDIKKGAAYHTENAIKFMQISKFDDAIRACRIALKADEDYVPAKLTMARAFLGKNVYDEAQKWAEDAFITEESVESAELLSTINADQAFSVLSMSGERGDALKEILNRLKNAVTYKKTAHNLRIKALGAVTDANRLQVVDVHIRNNDYGAARRLLREKWNELQPELSIGNRLLFVEMRSGRMKEAMEVGAAIEKHGAPDEVTYALMSGLHAFYRQYDKASEYLRNAILAGQESPTTITAAAYIAFRRNDTNAMNSQVQELLRRNIAEPETFFYLSTLQFYAGDFMASRDNFRKAVKQNPLLFDSFIQRAFEAMALSQRPNVSAEEKDVFMMQAKGYMEIALTARPESSEALNGLAIIYLLQKDYDQALRNAEAAVRAGPQYPWTWFTYSAALDAKRMTVDAQKAVDTAGSLDTVVLKGRAIPTVQETWSYTVTNGRIPTLYPPK